MLGPLLFLAACGAAAGSVDASPGVWAASLALLFAAAACLRNSRSAGLTPISLALWAYALWLIATNATANPAYTPAAPFHAAFLAGGFALGRRLEAGCVGRGFAWLAAGAAGLAVWALWQIASGETGRGHAHFETPNTLATVLNLVLAPTLALSAWRTPRAWSAALGVVLAAGLAATASRGGFLSLACALLAAFVAARHVGMPVEWRGALRVVALLALGWSLAALAPSVADWLPAAPGAPGRHAAAAHAMFGAVSQESSASRLELYALAASGLAGHLGAGIGYLGFNWLLEAHRLAVPSYGAGEVTYFAHNDYLQTLVELGVPGLAALLAMVFMPLLIALRRGTRAAGDPRVPMAALAAITTMAVHAVVDFPFYVPLCLLLFGLALGVAERSLAQENTIRERWRTAPARIARVLMASLVLFLLARPVVAEAAAAVAQRRWQAADGQAAAYWFEVARRIERRDWRYHWYAGQFWLAQAEQTAHPAAARLADDAFAAGFAANPREPRNLVGRIATHRRFGRLLAAPADAAMLRGWIDQAVALAPYNAQVLAEQAAVLDYLRRLAGEART